MVRLWMIKIISINSAVFYFNVVNQDFFVD